MRSVIKILSNRNHSQEKMIELYQTGLNNTASTDQSYIIFTKNAKTGSETVKSVISKLSKKNNFTMVTENFYSYDKLGYLNRIFLLTFQV